MIDIDPFKSFNDRFGHQAGDNGLRLVARALFEASRRTDAVLARYGGEEFALLIEGMDARQVGAGVAEDLRSAVAAISARFGRDAAPTSMSVSIGVASLVPGPDVASSDLIGAADAALYRAKRRGRNCVEVDDPFATPRPDVPAPVRAYG